MYTSMPGCIRVCQDVYGVCQDVYEYARMYTSMPISSTQKCIRVCQDVYEYARTYTSMPECIKQNHTICKDSPVELFFREFRIVRIDPSRLPSIVERVFIQPSFIWCQNIQKQLKNVKNWSKSGFGDIDFLYIPSLRLYNHDIWYDHKFNFVL